MFEYQFVPVISLKTKQQTLLSGHFWYGGSSPENSVHPTPNSKLYLHSVQTMPGATSEIIPEDRVNSGHSPLNQQQQYIDAKYIFHNIG